MYVCVCGIIGVYLPIRASGKGKEIGLDVHV